MGQFAEPLALNGFRVRMMPNQNVSLDLETKTAGTLHLSLTRVQCGTLAEELEKLSFGHHATPGER